MVDEGGGGGDEGDKEKEEKEQEESKAEAEDERKQKSSVHASSFGGANQRWLCACDGDSQIISVLGDGAPWTCGGV